jgi:hypothetical protein
MADQFFSTKRSAESLKKDAGPTMAMPMEQELYPWGMCISFDSDTLEVVPMPEGLTVGDTVSFTVRAKVKRLSEEETTEGTEKRLELQITEMTEPSPFVADVPTAERIYGKA